MYDHFRFFHFSHAQKEYHMVFSRASQHVFIRFPRIWPLSGSKKVVFLQNVVYNLCRKSFFL